MPQKAFRFRLGIESASYLLLVTAKPLDYVVSADLCNSLIATPIGGVLGSPPPPPPPLRTFIYTPPATTAAPPPASPGAASCSPGSLHFLVARFVSAGEIRLDAICASVQTGRNQHH